MKLGDSMILEVRFYKEDNSSSSTLRWVSSINISVKTCCSLIFVVIVMFVDSTSLNLFW